MTTEEVHINIAGELEYVDGTNKLYTGKSPSGFISSHSKAIYPIFFGHHDIGKNIRDGFKDFRIKVENPHIFDQIHNKNELSSTVRSSRIQLFK